MPCKHINGNVGPEINLGNISLENMDRRQILLLLSIGRESFLLPPLPPSSLLQRLLSQTWGFFGNTGWSVGHCQEVLHSPCAVVAVVGRDAAAPSPGSNPLPLPVSAFTGSFLGSHQQAEFCWLEGTCLLCWFRSRVEAEFGYLTFL